MLLVRSGPKSLVLSGFLVLHWPRHPPPQRPAKEGVDVKEAVEDIDAENKDGTGDVGAEAATGNGTLSPTGTTIRGLRA